MEQYILYGRSREQPFIKLCNKGTHCRRLRSKRCTFIHRPIDLANKKVLRDPYFRSCLFQRVPTCLKNYREQCKILECQYVHQEDIDHWLNGLNRDDTDYVLDLFRIEHDTKQLVRDYISTRHHIECNYHNSQTYWSLFYDYYGISNNIFQQEINGRQIILVQFQSNLSNVRLKIMQYNPSKLIVSSHSSSCEVCLDDDRTTSVIFRCLSDGHCICLDCLVDYLRSQLELIPVAPEKTYVPGIYCPLNRTHLLVLSQTFRTIMRASGKFEEELEEMEMRLYSRYQSEREREIEINAKNVALEQFLNTGQIRTLVMEIENNILIDVCPKCKRPYTSDGCEAVYCECGYKFCNVCLVFSSRLDIHEHVRTCIKAHVTDHENDYFLGSKRIEWRLKQRCQRIRQFLSDKRVEDITGILVQLYDRHQDLRSNLINEFTDYSCTLTGSNIR